MEWCSKSTAASRRARPAFVPKATPVPDTPAMKVVALLCCDLVEVPGGVKNLDLLVRRLKRRHIGKRWIPSMRWSSRTTSLRMLTAFGMVASTSPRVPWDMLVPRTSFHELKRILLALPWGEPWFRQDESWIRSRRRSSGMLLRQIIFLRTACLPTTHLGTLKDVSGPECRGP